MKSKTRRVPAALRRYMGSRMYPEKCSDIKKILELSRSLVNCSISAPHSHRDSIEIIARNASIPIESLSEALAAPISPRGTTYFSNLGRVLDQIASQYTDMFWWMSDKGLNVGIVNFENVLPNPFDELAGTLMMKLSKDGKLSRENLLKAESAMHDYSDTLIRAPMATHCITVSRAHNGNLPRC